MPVAPAAARVKHGKTHAGTCGAQSRWHARDAKAQRSRPATLLQWLEGGGSRDEALRRAHTERGMTMTALATELGLSVSRISRLIARGEEANGKT